MCKRHSFIITRNAVVHHGYGITDSHTTILDLAGLSINDDTANAYEWQPPAGWPDASFELGLTKDSESFELKQSHLDAMRVHIHETYPTMTEWNTPDAPRLFRTGLKIQGDLDLRNTGITSLPEGLSVGGDLDLSGSGITSLPEGLSVKGKIYR